MLDIRPETKDDLEAVRKVNNRAFGQSTEGRIVDKLRCLHDEIISLVAVKEGSIVGHILFSPVTIVFPDKTVRGLGLGPMSVLPEFQRSGIGSQLVNKALDSIRKTSCPFVVVLGHPDYYVRFGFTKAGEYGVRCQWDDVPDEAFMILVLDREKLTSGAGVARYREEFG